MPSYSSLKSWSSVLLVLTVSAGFVSAKSTSVDGKEKEKEKAPKAEKPFVYLTDTSVDWLTLIPPPPTKDSDEQKAELLEIHALQEHKSEEIKERCKMEAPLDAMPIFASVFGSDFTAERLPHVAKLLKSAKTDAKHFVDTAKDHWGRSRPPYADPTLTPGVTSDDQPSYPSGHSTVGMVYAELLSAMAPEKKDALLPRGEMVGFDRVFAAVHYPSDVVAGRVLGQAVANALLADPKFKSDFEAAKEELRSSVQLASK